MKKVLILPNYATQTCENYIKACIEAGLDPTLSDSITDPSFYDGLILPGGADISPRFYGESNQNCLGVNLAFDQLEYKTMEAFVNAGKPILGICRGMQFINVYFGGSLFQHIDNHKMDNGDLHKIVCVPHTAFARLFNDEMMVNTHHHQAVKKLGNDLEIFARAEDGTVEGINHINNKILGVQWHPEKSLDDTMDKSGGIYVLKLFAAILAQQQ